MLRTRHHAEQAASETTGTILLLAIAVALAGVFALAIFNLPPPLPSSHATLQAFTPPASDQVVIEHRGGPAIPLSSLTAAVRVNGTLTQFNVAAGITNGTWTVVAPNGTAKSATDSFAAGDQAIYTAPALWGADASVQVVNGATTGGLGAALALAPTTVQAKDDVRPTFVSARTLTTTTIQANFTEPVRNLTDPASVAISPRDFTVQNAGVTYSVSAVRLLANGSAAELTLGSAMPSSATPYVNSTASPAWTSDLAGNAFLGGASVVASDGVAPAVTGVAASSPSVAGATITWTTDETAATSSVYVGPTPGLGIVASAPAGGTSHSLTLSTLSDNQQYYFEVVSTDANGNAAVSSLQAFNTSQLPASSGGGSGSNRLSLPSSVSLTSGVISPALTVTLKDPNGTALNATGNTVVSLSTNSTSGSFFSDAAGASPVTSVTILAGQSTATFYYRDYRDAGASVLGAQSEGVVPASTLAQVSLNSGRTFAYHLVFTALPAMPIANGVDVPGFTVALRDVFDQPVVPPWTMTVNLSTNSTVGYFTDAGGSTINSISLSSSSASFKYHDARGGPALVMAFANGTQPAAAQVTVSGSSQVFGLLSGAQTWTGINTYGAGLLNVTNLATPNGTLLLPDGNDTLMDLGGAQTVTGVKTFGSGTLRATDLYDANGKAILNLSATPNAIDGVTITDAASGGTVTIGASGGDANVPLNLVSKGSGALQLNGQPISLSGAFTTSGGNAITFTTTGTTSLALPTSGTLLSTSGAVPAHDLIVGTGTNPVAFLAPSATSGVPLVSQGSSADPAFGAINLGSSSAVTGTISTTNLPTIPYSKLSLTGLIQPSDLSAAVNGSWILNQNSQVLTGHLAAASVTAEKLNLNASSIAYSKLNLANSIVASDITAGAITTAKIAGGAVTTADLAASVNSTFLANASNTVGGANVQNGAIDLTTKVTGTLPVGNGGTGATSFTTNGVVLGGATLTSTAAGSPNQVLRIPSGGGAPAFGQLNLASSAAVTGTLPIANGGTGLASAGGTANRVLVTTDGSTWSAGQVNLNSAMVTGGISPTNGGTGQSTYTLGDTLYADAANSLAKLPGNTVATKMFLSQTGTGAVSAAPSWSALAAGDIPNLDASKITTGTFADARLSTNVALLNAANAWTQVQTFNAGILLTPMTNTSIPACTAGLEGSLWWDNTNHTLRVCGKTGSLQIVPTSDATRLINHVFPGTGTTETIFVTEPDTNYGVVCSPQYAASQNIIISNKQTTQFTVTYGTGGRGQTADCFIFR